jgi:hypothetical protein
MGEELCARLRSGGAAASVRWASGLVLLGGYTVAFSEDGQGKQTGARRRDETRRGARGDKKQARRTGHHGSRKNRVESSEDVVAIARQGTPQSRAEQEGRRTAGLKRAAREGEGGEEGGKTPEERRSRRGGRPRDGRKTEETKPRQELRWLCWPLIESHARTRHVKRTRQGREGGPKKRGGGEERGKTGRRGHRARGGRQEREATHQARGRAGRRRLAGTDRHRQERLQRKHARTPDRGGRERWVEVGVGRRREKCQDAPSRHSHICLWRVRRVRLQGKRAKEQRLRKQRGPSLRGGSRLKEEERS